MQEILSFIYGQYLENFEVSATLVNIQVLETYGISKPFKDFVYLSMLLEQQSNPLLQQQSVIKAIVVSPIFIKTTRFQDIVCLQT